MCTGLQEDYNKFQPPTSMVDHHPALNLCVIYLQSSTYERNRELLQILVLQEFCKLVLGISWPENQGGTTQLCGVTDMEYSSRQGSYTGSDWSLIEPRYIAGYNLLLPWSCKLGFKILKDGNLQHLIHVWASLGKTFSTMRSNITYKTI